MTMVILEHISQTEITDGICSRVIIRGIVKVLFNNL